jgi:hypothetical protein
MKPLFVLGLILSANIAVAGTQTCSNATQTLNYTHRTDPLGDQSILKYEQYSQHTLSADDVALDFHLSQIDVREQRPSGNQILVTTVAFAQGSIISRGHKVPYHDWVVCTELGPKTVAEKD